MRNLSAHNNTYSVCRAHWAHSFLLLVCQIPIITHDSAFLGRQEVAQHSGNVFSPQWEAISHVSVCVCAHPVILDIIYSTQGHICTNPRTSFTQTQFPVCHYHSPSLLLVFLSKKDSIQEEALHTRAKLTSVLKWEMSNEIRLKDIVMSDVY